MSATVTAPAVDRQQAIAIAEADAVPVYGNSLNVLTLEVALHDDGWHVEYHMRRPRWAGGGPHYVIDA
ncbi:MAG: hypothetical protein K2X82_25900, partial [Gemmataceae bacterium]|nr:hypothetical protein [Gemmataceae bacterium]